MAESKLTTVSGSGTQTTTQSPQSATGQTDSPAAQSGTVQPGTAASVLTSNEGIALQQTPLTTVSLGTTVPVQTVALPPPTPHHFNPALLSIPVLLCLVAIVMFWSTSHSAKNTTNYS